MTRAEEAEPRHRLVHQDNHAALDALAAEGLRFQLVYLDPPYNTGRLRGARRDFRDTSHRGRVASIAAVAQASHALLRAEGFLAASINQAELFNLKPALDVVFGAECFVGLFPVKIRHRDRQLMINATYHDLFEYLLVYRKTRATRFFTAHKSPRPDKFIHAVRPHGAPAEVREIRGKRVEIYPPGAYEIVEIGHTPEALRRYVIAGKLATANWSGEWYESHLRSLGNDFLIRVFGLEKEGLGHRWFQTGNARRRSGVYFQSQLNAGRPTLPANDLDFTEVMTTIFREGGPGCDFKDSKKPEALLAFLLEICTRKGDLVLDPYAGSGTTLAAAVKLGRAAVLVEKSTAAVTVIRKRITNLREGKDVDGVRRSFAVDEIS